MKIRTKELDIKLWMSQKVEQNDKEMENRTEIIRKLEYQSRIWVSGVPDRTEETGEEILKETIQTLKNIRYHSEVH